MTEDIGSKYNLSSKNTLLSNIPINIINKQFERSNKSNIESSRNLLYLLQDKLIELDDKILELIASRRKISTKIGYIKEKNNIQLKDENLEQALIKALIEKGKKRNINQTLVKQLYQAIIEDSFLIQKSILLEKINAKKVKSVKIAFLGPQGSYSHSAARKYVNYHSNNITEISCSSFSEVFNQVESGLADYAVLPIENSTSGYIKEVYDLLKKTDLHIINEMSLKIDHCILASPNSTLENIEIVYSHPQPFKQCSNFFNNNYPNWKTVYCESTSSAIQKVAKINQPNVAAIGSKDGGDIYGLKVLKHNLANKKENFTRFIVLSRQAIKDSDLLPLKTTIVMKTGQQSGALVDALLVLQNHKIVIKKIESSPTFQNVWNEIFYLDLQGNVETIEMQKALKELESKTIFLKVLGCYPYNDLF